MGTQPLGSIRLGLAMANVSVMQGPTEAIDHRDFGCTKMTWPRKGEGRQLPRTFGRTKVAALPPRRPKIGEAFAFDEEETSQDPMGHQYGRREVDLTRGV